MYECINTMLALRLTMGGNITPDSVAAYFQDAECLITSENEDSNHHYHILLKTTANVNAVRNKMNRHFKPAKNQTYCKADKGMYSTYIVKCGNIIKNNIYSSEELEAFVSASYEKKKRAPSKTARLVESFDPEYVEFITEDLIPSRRLANPDDLQDEMLTHFIANYDGPFGLKHCQEFVFGALAIHDRPRLLRILKKKIIFS